ncbi:activating transcription factor 7-interacting protein 2 [Lissotriton helveticus]
MEPSSGGKKIFRARKTMTPSSRHQIESLNKLRDILEKERVSKETTKESRTVPLTKQDDTNCENDVFGQIFKVESKSPLSEEKDVSPNKLKVSVEVLGIDSTVAACSPEKDTCHFNHQTEQSLSPSEVKSYTIEKPPLSKTPIENPFIQNILNDIYDQEACGVFSEHTVGNVASKLQDSLSRRLHDMLVQEKRLLATTSPTPLEADSENEDVKVTDQVFPISEKIVIPLNLSEGDDDEGFLPVLEQQNAKVDGDIANQPDGAVALQDLNPGLPYINPVSQSGSDSISHSVQLPITDTLDSNVKSKIVSIPDHEKMTCLDESKTFPQGTMDINPVSQSGRVSIPCSPQLPIHNTLDTNVKREIITIPDNEKVTCLDESQTSPQKDAMDINPVSQSGGASIPCSVQLPINNTLDTNVKSKIISILDDEKMMCLDESQTSPQKDAMDINPVSQSGGASIPCSVQLPINSTLDSNVESKIISIPDDEKMMCLDESQTSPQKDAMDINPVSQSGGASIPCSVQLPINNTLDTNVKSRIISIPDNEKIMCLDESKMFPQKDAMDINPVSQSGGACIPCSMQLPIHDTLDTNVKSKIISILDDEKMMCLDESQTSPQKDSMDINHVSQSVGASIPCSVQLPINNTLDTNVNSRILSIPDNEKRMCLDESKMFPQKDAMDINPVSQSGGASIPCSVQLPINNTLDTNVKNKIITIPDNEKMMCLDESKSLPQKDSMDINLVSQSGDASIPCSVQLPINDTLNTNVKREIISIPDKEKKTCLDESKSFPQKDAMDISPVSKSGSARIPCSPPLLIHNTFDTNVKREIITIPDNEKVTCLDESQKNFQDTMDVDMNNEPFGETESKTDTDLGGKITLPQTDTPAIGLEGNDSPGCAIKRLSCPEAEANSKKEMVAGNLNNAALCTYFSEAISCQELEVSSQNIDSSMESNIGCLPRKRLNSGNESTACKRFKSVDDEDSSKSEKIHGISDKVKILINRQLQILFSDVFDERLEQLTERVNQIQCGKKHEELAAKCLHKLRRFEKNANIAVKSLKSLLRQHKMQSLATEPKGTVSHGNILTVQQALLIDKPVPVNEVITSTTTQPCLPLYLQPTSSAQFSTSVTENTTANSADLAHGHGSSALKSSMLVSANRNVPGHVDSQNVSSSVSPASWNSLKAESGAERVVLDERHAESESFNEKVRLKSLTSGIPDGLSRRASTDRGSVLNVKSNNEVSNEEIKKCFGVVIDLTEEESSSNTAVTIKDEESSLKIQNPHCKEIEATGTKSLWSLTNVNDQKMNAFLGMQKYIQSIKSPQRSNLEHLNSPEVSRVSLSTKMNPNDEATKELSQKYFGVSENAAQPTFDKSNYGKIEQSNLEVKGVQKSRTGPLATYSKNVEKTLQNLTIEKRTSVESIAKPLNTVLTDTLRPQYMSHVGSVLGNKPRSFPTSLTSQDKETTKKSNQAMEKYFQPTLTQPELRGGVKDSLPPQKIDLKLTQVQNPRGIALSWNCAEVDLRCCPAHSYCLYVQQEDLKCNRSEWKWKKIGEIKALPLPMACTLSHFVGGSRYYFTLRAKDIYERYGPFSDIQTTLLPLEMSHDITVAKTPGHT